MANVLPVMNTQGDNFRAGGRMTEYTGGGVMLGGQSITGESP